MSEQKPDVPADLQAQIDTVKSIEEADKSQSLEQLDQSVPKPKKALWRRLLSLKAFAIYLVIACVSYPVIGFFGVPALIKHVILPDINQDIRGAIQVQRIDVNPYTFRMEMSGIKLVDEAGETLTTCDRFIGDLEFASLWRGQGIILKQVLVENPDLKLVVSPDGTVNAIHALEPLEPRLPEIKTFELPYMTVEELKVTGASYHLVDQRLSPAFEHSTSGIALSMNDFTSAAGVYTPLNLDLKTDLDEVVELTANLCAEPIGMKGSLSLSQAKLTHYYPYVKYLTQDKLKLNLPDGKVDLSLNWHVALLDDEPQVTLQIPSLTLSDMHLKHGLKADAWQTLAELDEIEIAGVNVDVIKRQLVVESVKVSDGHAAAELLEGGSLNLLALLTPFMGEGSGELSLKGDNEQGGVLEKNTKVADAIEGPIPGVIPPEVVSELLAILNEVKEAPSQFIQLNISQNAIELAKDAVSNPWYLEVTKTNIGNQSFDFTDHMSGQPLALPLKELSIEVDAITSKNGFKLPVSIKGKLSDAPITAKGHVDPFTQMAQLKVTAQDLDLTPFMPYVRPHAHVDMRSGLLNADGTVTAYLNHPETGGLSYGFQGDATLNTVEILKALPGEEVAPLVKVKSLVADDVQASGPKWQLAAAGITVTEPDLKAALKSDGTLSTLDLIKRGSPETSLQSSPPTAEVKLPVAIDIKRVLVNNGALHFTDQMQSPAVELALKKLNVDLGQLNVKPDVDLFGQGIILPVAIRAELDGAPLSAEGKVDVTQMLADLKVSATGLSIPPFMAYAREYVAAELRDGKLTAEGRAVATLKDPKTQSLSYGFEGNVAIDDFLLFQAGDEAAEPLVGFKNLAVKNVNASGPAWRMHADRVAITEPLVRAELTKEGKPAMLSMLSMSKLGGDTKAEIAEKETAPETKTAKSSLIPPMTLPVDLLIKDVVIADGHVTLKDHSQSPVFASSLSKLNVAIGPIHGTPEQMAEFKISGYIAGKGKLKMQGQSAPLDILRETTAKMTLNGMPLVPFDPFTRRYAGYTVDKGELATLASDVMIKNGLMDIKNSLVLGSMYLGEKVKSEEAINAPLKMGMALLRDKDDRIVLDLPLHGDLNNPKFKIVPVIKSAITERFKQVAAAPFDTLAGAAGMVGEVGSIAGVEKVGKLGLSKIGKIANIAGANKVGEMVGVAKKPDLSYLVFESGVSVLSEQEAKKLDYMIKGLDRRPEIRLAVTLHVSDDELASLKQRSSLSRLTELAGKPITATQGEDYEAALAIYYRGLRSELEDFLKAELTKPKVTESEGVEADAVKTDTVALEAEAASSDPGTESQEAAEAAETNEAETDEAPTQQTIDPEVELLPERPLPPVKEIETLFLSSIKVDEVDLAQLRDARVALLMDRFQQAGLVKRVRMKKGILPVKDLDGMPHFVFEIE